MHTPKRTNTIQYAHYLIPTSIININVCMHASMFISGIFLHMNKSFWVNLVRPLISFPKIVVWSCPFSSSIYQVPTTVAWQMGRFNYHEAPCTLHHIIVMGVAIITTTKYHGVFLLLLDVATVVLRILFFQSFVRAIKLTPPSSTGMYVTTTKFVVSETTSFIHNIWKWSECRKCHIFFSPFYLLANIFITNFSSSVNASSMFL